MGDNNRGLYGKFYIERTDGQSALGQKHDGCDYFVLDLSHDRHAAPALRAYAESCAAEYPLLSRDLKLMAHVVDERTLPDREPAAGEETQ